jgi:predicted DNA-binding transcriptional regulator AlpA
MVQEAPGLDRQPHIIILFMRDLTAHLRCTPNQIRRLRQLDPTFLKPIQLGTGRNGRIAWYRGEIDEWLANRPRAVLPSIITSAESSSV